MGHSDKLPSRQDSPAESEDKYHQAMRLLAESEQRYRSLFEHNFDAVYSLDLDGNFLTANHAVERMSGYTQAEIRRMSYLAYIDPEHQAARASHFERAVAGETVNYDTVVVRKSGERVQANVTNLPIVVDGKVVGVYGIARDITEQRQAHARLRHQASQLEQLNTELEERVRMRTQQLEEANRELEAFSYSVSHDLRAPLNTIDGFSQILSRHAGGQLNERDQHYLDRIRNGVRQMTDLIDALLVLAKITRMKPCLEAVDLSALAAEVAAEQRQQAPAHAVKFTVQPGLLARGDSRLLRQALVNLVGNAWKFTGKAKQPRVEVGAQAGEDGRAVFFVKDNGAGFDMTYATKLFGAFQRLHKQTEFPGNGVGLAMVNRIVSLHRGKIWVEAAVDQGATFFFTLTDVPC